MDVQIRPAGMTTDSEVTNFIITQTNLILEFISGGEHYSEREATLNTYFLSFQGIL